MNKSWTVVDRFCVVLARCLVAGDAVVGLEDHPDLCCHLLPSVCLRESHVDCEGKTRLVWSPVH